MIDPHMIAATASVGLGTVGSFLYVRAVLAGHTKPHMFTWLIWGVLMTIGGAVALAENAFWSGFCLIIGGGVNLAIAFFAVRAGSRDITLLDKIMFGAAVAAIPLWLVTKEPLAAAIMITCIDAAGYFPTFRKGWIKPFEENMKIFLLFVPTSFLSVLAVSPFHLTTALYPTMIVGMNAALVIMLALRRKALRR